MSVIVKTAAEVHTLWSNAVKLVGAELACADLFTAMHAAQGVAYALTYGEAPGGEMFSNRAPQGGPGSVPTPDLDAATMTPAELQDKLRGMEYNWCSNGGTDCLPARYQRPYTALQRALTVKVLSNPHDREQARVGSVTVKNDGMYGVMVIPGDHSGARVVGASGTEYTAHHFTGSDVGAIMAHCEAISADIEAAWEARMVADGRKAAPDAPLVIEYTPAAAYTYTAPEMSAPDAFAALVGDLVATPKAQAYLDRLVCPLKKAYAAAVVAELAGGPVAVAPAGLNAERAGEVRGKVTRLMVMGKALVLN